MLLPRRNSPLTVAATWLTLIAFTAACGTQEVAGIVVYPDGGAADGGAKFAPKGGADVGSGQQQDAFSAAEDAADVQTKREIIVLLNNTIPQVIAPNGLLPINVKVID